MKRSLRDDAFRAALLADPKRTLEREAEALTGQPVTLPRNVNVSVHEETPEHIHLIIPAGSPPARLSDAELARVAGGLEGRLAQPICGDGEMLARPVFPMPLPPVAPIPLPPVPPMLKWPHP